MLLLLHNVRPFEGVPLQLFRRKQLQISSSILTKVPLNKKTGEDPREELISPFEVPLWRSDSESR